MGTINNEIDINDNREVTNSSFYKNKSNPQQLGRFIYVDPNDSEGRIDGVSVTPEYSDMCISFTMTVDIINRLNKTDNTLNGFNGTKSFSLSWVSKPGEEKNEVSFLGGSKLSNNSQDVNPTFLTTFYTDISFDDINSKDIVEGLGVTSIDISYESYYVPTIKMKFIDTRGSSLFGREEAIHNNKNKITVDDLFGCFFTIPYPRFRLQVKGFYGRPVTFQMSCSDFRGTFNSNTGNFEADVTFLGYDYGIFADVPIKYIMAAPYCDYAGREYWNEHVNNYLSNGWKLSSEIGNLNPNLSDKPITILQIIKKIKKAIENNKNSQDNESNNNVNSNTPTDSSNITNLINEYNARTQANKIINTFLSYNLKNYFGNGFTLFNISEKNTDLILYKNKTYYDFSNLSISNKKTTLNKQLSLLEENVINALNGIWTKDTLKEYSILGNNSKNKIGDIFNNDTKNKNNNYIVKSSNGTVTSEDNYMMGIDSNNNTNNNEIKANNTSSSNNISVVNSQKITSVYDLNSKTYIDLSDCNVNKLISNGNEDYKESLLVCISYKDFSDANNVEITKCKQKLNDLNIKTEDLNNNTNSDIISERKIVNLPSIKDVVGFVPYIGNVFKIIFCHLETFLHMMYYCTNIIYSESKDNKRTASNLGLNSNDSKTDIDSKNNEDKIAICPFPAILKRKEDKDQLNNGEIWETGWVGDCIGSVDWQEKLLLDSLFDAIITNFGKNQESYSGNISTIAFPIIPSDIITKNSSEINNLNIPSLSSYLGIRASILFGIMDKNISEDMAKNIGVLDGFNLYNNIDGNKESLKNFCNNIKNDKITLFEQIMLCTNDSYAEQNKDSESKVNIFEKYKVTKNRRQPIFENNNNNLDYIYTNTGPNKVTSIIPLKIDNYNNIFCNTNNINGDILSESNENTTYFYPNLLKNDINYYIRNLVYSNTAKKTLSCVKDKDINDLITNNGNAILNTYYNDNICSIKTELSYITYVENLYKNIQTGDINLPNYNGSINKWSSEFLNKYYLVSEDNYNTFYEKKSSFTYNIGKISGFFKYDDTYKEQNLASSDDDITNWTLFGSDTTEQKFNYVKNMNEFVLRCLSYKTTTDTKFSYSLFGGSLYYMQNNINDEDTKNKSKALLFLHTFNYDYNNVITMLSKDIGYIGEIPYIIIALIGGLIWRQRYMNENSKDPIQLVDQMIHPKNDETFLVNVDGNYVFTFITKDHQANYKYMTIAYLCKDWNYEFANQCLDIFNSFVNNDWTNIEEYLELKPNNTSMNGSDFNSFLQDLITEIENTKDNTNYHTSAISYLKGQNITNIDSYAYIFPPFNKGEVKDKKKLVTVIGEDSTIQDILKKLYLKKTICLFTRPLNGITDGYEKVSIKKSILESYLSGFSTALENIIKSSDTNTSSTENEETKEHNKDRDLKLSMYIYLKNLWDRWLINNTEENYTVRNYFEKNFIFIDSFYNNIYDVLKINCNKLLDVFTSNIDDGMLLKIFSTISKDHNCMFFGMPDYVFSKNSDESMLMNLKDLFKPMAYNNMPAMNMENKIILMYVHKPSEIAYGVNGYKDDSYDILAGNTSIDNFRAESLNSIPVSDYIKNIENNKETDNNKTTKQKDKELNTNDPNIIGIYNTPSFGIAFSRQNNSYFKTINISMNNPAVTEPSILATTDIVNKGSGGTKAYTFYGQDLFPVYSGYSYTCDIEMMGNAQIVPLMYFVLLNVPMFKGAYMIYQVSHTISQGNMVTRFKGMKMSRHVLPMTSEWFTEKNINAFIESNTYEDCQSTDNNDLNYSTTELTNNEIESRKFATTDGNGTNNNYKKDYTDTLVTPITIKYHNENSEETTSNITVNKYITENFKIAFERIFNEVGNFRIYHISAYEYRHVFIYNEYEKGKYKQVEGNDLSTHSYGVAVDINGKYNPYVRKQDIDKYREYDQTYQLRRTDDPVVKIFEECGFYWGGRFKNPDYMHFSYYGG